MLGNVEAVFEGLCLLDLLVAQPVHNMLYIICCHQVCVYLVD